MNIIII